MIRSDNSTVVQYDIVSASTAKAKTNKNNFVDFLLMQTDILKGDLIAENLL
jgi:hypothetical protein